MSEPQSGEVIKRYLLFCKNPQSFQASSYYPEIYSSRFHSPTKRIPSILASI